MRGDRRIEFTRRSYLFMEIQNRSRRYQSKFLCRRYSTSSKCIQLNEWINLSLISTQQYQLINLISISLPTATNDVSAVH